jgi:hypothetical protein
VQTLRQADPWVPTAAELQSLVGRYRSDDIGVTFTVRMANGTLVLSPRSGVESVLTPTYRDAFSSDGGAVWFVRSKGGAIREMHFGESRVWDITTVRVP